MVTEAEVRTVLDEVIHPSFGMSLIALDMVRAVRVSDDRIEVDLVMNCPGCPAGEVTLTQAHQNLTALNGSDVQANLLPQRWTPPWGDPVRQAACSMSFYRHASQFQARGRRGSQLAVCFPPSHVKPWLNYVTRSSSPPICWFLNMMFVM